ncbi:hypothetical protein C8R47DRAFT_1217968 [Mycena vitilis]|nr:hypothetical protein C8R47DRAFT_1217968 [Mycena vitilis]
MASKRSLPRTGSEPSNDSGWHTHSYAPDPAESGPAKRHRDNRSSESSESDLENDPGWTLYGGEQLGVEADTASESEVASSHLRRPMDYDSARSDDGFFFKRAHPQEGSDVDMADAQSYDFDDFGGTGYVDPDDDVDMGASDQEESVHMDGSLADTSGNDDVSSEDEERPSFPNKHMREHYESLRNAPRGAPATKNDLATFIRLFQTLPSQSTPGRFKRTVPQPTPQHRSASTVHVQRLVRDVTRKAMGLASKDTPLTDEHVPSREDVARFAKTKSADHGPHLPKLRVDVGTPKLASLWNTEVIRVLCVYFLEHVSLEPPMKKQELAQVFKTHLQTLRAHYVAGTANPTSAQRQDAIDAKAKRAQANRLRTLRNQRVQAAELIAETDPTLRKLLPLIKSLPKNAMSGDEADHQHGNARYVAQTLEWRADIVSPFVSTLDDLHLSGRFNGDGSAGRGKFPHVRIRNTARPPTPGNPPPKLPRNFYDSAWVASLTDFERRALKMKPSVNLDFSPAVLRHAARFHHIIDGSQRPLDINDPSLPFVPRPGRKPHSSANRRKGQHSKGKQ